MVAPQLEVWMDTIKAPEEGKEGKPSLHMPAPDCRLQPLSLEGQALSCLAAAVFPPSSEGNGRTVVFTLVR